MIIVGLLAATLMGCSSTSITRKAYSPDGSGVLLEETEAKGRSMATKRGLESLDASLNADGTRTYTVKGYTGVNEEFVKRALEAFENAIPDLVAEAIKAAKGTP